VTWCRGYGNAGLYHSLVECGLHSAIGGERVSEDPEPMLGCGAVPTYPALLLGGQGAGPAEGGNQTVTPPTKKMTAALEGDELMQGGFYRQRSVLVIGESKSPCIRNNGKVRSCQGKGVIPKFLSKMPVFKKRGLYLRETELARGVGGLHLTGDSDSLLTNSEPQRVFGPQERGERGG